MLRGPSSPRLSKTWRGVSNKMKRAWVEPEPPPRFGKFNESIATKTLHPKRSAKSIRRQIQVGSSRVANKGRQNALRAADPDWPGPPGYEIQIHRLWIRFSSELRLHSCDRHAFGRSIDCRPRSAWSNRMVQRTPGLVPNCNECPKEHQHNIRVRCNRTASQGPNHPSARVSTNAVRDLAHLVDRGFQHQPSNTSGRGILAIRSDSPRQTATNNQP